MSACSFGAAAVVVVPVGPGCQRLVLRAVWTSLNVVSLNCRWEYRAQLLAMEQHSESGSGFSAKDWMFSSRTCSSHCPEWSFGRDDPGPTGLVGELDAVAEKVLVAQIGTTRLCCGLGPNGDPRVRTE